MCALWPWIPLDRGKQNKDSLLFLTWPKQTDCGLDMSLYICICLCVICLIKYYNTLPGTAKFYSWANRPLSTGRTHVILMKIIFQNVEIQNLSIISKALSMEMKYNWVEIWKSNVTEICLKKAPKPLETAGELGQYFWCSLTCHTMLQYRNCPKTYIY